MCEMWDCFMFSVLQARDCQIILKYLSSITVKTLSGHFIRYTLLVLCWTHFAFRAVLIIQWWKHSSATLFHIAMMASHSCCRFHDVNLLFHLSRALLDWDLLTVEEIWVDVNLVTWRVILVEAAIRKWAHYGHKGVDMEQQQYLGRLWCLNDGQLALRDPQCAIQCVCCCSPSATGGCYE